MRVVDSVEEDSVEVDLEVDSAVEDSVEVDSAVEDSAEVDSEVGDSAADLVVEAIETTHEMQRAKVAVVCRQ